MAVLRIVNLDRYQHYSKRNPPWVKLHQGVLESYEFGMMKDAHKYHALALVLLASRLDNQIPDDPLWIAGKIQARTPIDVDALVSSGFVMRCEQDASGELVEGLCDAKPEERRGEREEREGGASGTQVRAASTKRQPKVAPRMDGPVPEEWRGVATALDRTEHLRDKVALRDWAWWDKLWAIYEKSDIDFVRQIARMDEWLDRNGVRKSDWKRFVSNWLKGE